ncbi:transcription factor TFIIIB component B'' homolog isoform X3 [Sphaerodactylus townsendi]|uniref:transcription factor TFIIIB component B'' homolog isoform X3 n=1 Tax=Sphaerodactylus townsendi TaxID=933632 RepID=UPI002025EB24|nr:transcription factor TFIIIB component B'' homolog isoform X3 [Sphaerodactylus townsendi]
MFRRARFNVKPNVRPSAGGRGSGGGNTSVAPRARHGSETAPSSAEAAASSDSQPGPLEDILQDRSSSNSRDEKSSNPRGDGDSSKLTDVPLQRRKRISTMPNLAKPRVALPSVRHAISSVAKCSQKQVPHSLPPVNSALQKESSSCEKINIEKSPILPEKKTPLPQVPQFSPCKTFINKETSLSVTSHKGDEVQQNNMPSPLKERPTQESLIQEEIQQPKTAAAAKENEICSDHDKIIKVKKLRRLLQDELKKEKQQRKYKYAVIEKHMPEDRSKMTMRDFIYYLPENNPMKPEEKIIVDHEDENEEVEEEEEEEDDGPLLVPRVKVAEDGSIILDEESLTVEVLRTKGQCVVEQNDPIFERGSTTTYSSFRKSYYTKPWSEKETEMFFVAISMVGTDFSMISQLFPHRARTEIKNKFKREEKANGWRIDKAFKEKRPFDFDLFAKLLEKVLENERRKKMNDVKCQNQKEKTANEKKVPKIQKKQKAKLTSGQPSHGQDDQDVRISDAEIEVDSGTAEKENEESLSILEPTEGQTVTESMVMKKKRKKKRKDSEQGAENLSERKTIPPEAVEGERLRMERKSISSSMENHGGDETCEELEVPDEQALEVEENAQCCVQQNEGTEGEDSLFVSRVQDGTYVEDESELQISDASSEDIVGQFSKSSIFSSTNKEGFEGTCAEMNEVAELDKLDESHRVPPSYNDKTETMDTERAATEQLNINCQLQRLEPNLTKPSEKSELPVDNALENELSPSEPVVGIGKIVVEDKAANITGSSTEELTERSNSNENRESQTCEKSTLQGNSGQSVVRPALLARGRMKKPKPNLGTASKRQAEPSRNSEAAEVNATEATVETMKTLTQHECSRSGLLPMQATEATSYEVDSPRSEALKNKAVATPDKVGLIHSIQPSLNEPLECVSFELKKASSSNDTVKDVSAFVSGAAGLQEIEKETAAETQHCWENFTQSLKKNLGEAAERKDISGPEKEMLEDNNLTGSAEKKTVPLTPECGKLSDLNEGAKGAILPSSRLSEGLSTDAQEEVSRPATFQFTPNFSTLDSSYRLEVSLSRDSQEVSSPGDRSSQEVGKQSAIQPMPLLRSRLQRPKPNISRSVGRKEIPSADKNEATAATLGTEKSKLQKSEPSRTSSIELQLLLDGKVLADKVSEDSLLDCEKMAPEDSQVPRSSRNISDCHTTKKTLLQEDKPRTIKPAQLMRGRFQKTRASLGKLNGKKKGPMSESVSDPVEGEKEKTETEALKIGDHHLPSQDEADVCTSLSDLEGKVQPESSGAILPERCIDQKRVSSEKSQSCEFLKDQVKMCMSKHAEKKQLDTLASGVSAPQEVSLSERVKLTRSPLQMPEPNLSKATKKKAVSSAGEGSTEDKARKDMEDKLEKISSLMHDSGKQVATTFSEPWRQENCADDIKLEDSKRSKHSEVCASSEQLLGGESPIRREMSDLCCVQERASETLKRKQPKRTVRQRKPVCDLRPTYSTSEETDHNEKGRRLQKVKPNVGRGRCLRPALGKKPKKEYGSSKVNLVTLRASSPVEEDDDDADDFEPDYEVECFLPEEVNKAPVFVPKGLRSPNPVPVQIEETMEELEIYENISEEVCVATSECLSHEQNIGAEAVTQENTELHSSQLVIIQERPEMEKGENDGSTEAAMTLLAMRDPAFQLNISTQENLQKCPNQDEQTVTDSFLNKQNEEQSSLDGNVPALPKPELISFNDASKTPPEDNNPGQSVLEGFLTAATEVILPGASNKEAVSSHNMSKTALMDHNEFGLVEHSQKASRVCSDGSSSKGNTILKPTRFRFPKPKPNLGRGKGINRSASLKNLDVGVEQSNQTQNGEKEPQYTAENEKAELEQNLRMDAPPSSSVADKHDFQLGRSSHDTQKNHTGCENLATETLQVTSVFSELDASPRTEAWLFELPDNSNTKINELPEKKSDPVEHHLPPEVAQVEESKHSGHSAATEITVSAGVKECPVVEEEQTIVLTLVEIPADSQDCSSVSASEELLPAPVFFISDNMELVELTKEDSSGSVKAAAEENTVSVANVTEIGELQTTLVEKPADCGSTSLKDQKRRALGLEGSGGPPKKKKRSSGESLKCSNQEVLLKSSSIAQKTAEKSSEKLNISKERNSATSRSVPEPTESHIMEEKEKRQTSLRLGVPPDTDEPMSRTLCSGKAKTSEKHRSFVDIYKPVRSGQIRSTAVLQKKPSSRPYQRSLGFLPLICKTSTEEVTTKGNRRSLKKPHVDVSKSTLECPTLSTKNKEDMQGNSSFPSMVSSSSKCENVSLSAVQVCSEQCENERSSKKHGKDEEPTRISEYFFRDIFMEVDDSE